MSIRQLKDNSRTKANCAICDKVRYFEGMVGGEYVCNKCYKPFFHGTTKERNKWEEWTGQGFLDMYNTNGEVLHKKLKHQINEQNKLIVNLTTSYKELIVLKDNYKKDIDKLKKENIAQYDKFTDYITDLERENKKLKEENIAQYDKFTDYITDLERENKKLKEENDKLKKILSKNEWFNCIKKVRMENYSLKLDILKHHNIKVHFCDCCDGLNFSQIDGAWEVHLIMRRMMDLMRGVVCSQYAPYQETIYNHANLIKNIKDTGVRY